MSRFAFFYLVEHVLIIHLKPLVNTSKKRINTDKAQKNKKNGQKNPPPDKIFPLSQKMEDSLFFELWQEELAISARCASKRQRHFGATLASLLVLGLWSILVLSLAVWFWMFTDLVTTVLPTKVHDFTVLLSFRKTQPKRRHLPEGNALSSTV